MTTITYMQGQHTFISKNATFSVSEIKFELDGYEVKMYNIRKEKLRKLRKINEK